MSLSCAIEFEPSQPERPNSPRVERAAEILPVAGSKQRGHLADCLPTAGPEADPGLDGGRSAGRRRRKGDAGVARRRVHLDPAVLLAELNIRALLKAERLLVQLDRPSTGLSPG
jgi:hypothetical protein